MIQRLDTLQKIEIAEGVEIDLRPAGLLIRGGAFLVDTLIKIGVYIVLSMVFGIVGGLFSAFDPDVGIGIYLGLLTLGTFTLEWLYSIIFEFSRWGATPGKRAFKIKVTQLSGSPITLNQAVIRNLIRFVDILPSLGAVGAITMLSNKRFQRLGDLAAATVVVYDSKVDLLRQQQDSIEPNQHIEVIRPSVNLSTEEQRAILTFSERSEDWSQPRIEELANHTGELINSLNSRERVNQLFGIARWIRSNQ